ncbi:MAG: transcription-repair coupling factor [bacterium]|nr:transcription-repair coupling factor [bacterium]
MTGAITNSGTAVAPRGGPGGLLQAALLDRVAGEGLERAVAGLRAALQAPGEGPLLVTGLRGGATGLMLAAWHAASGRPALVVAPDREVADRLADDLVVWLGPDAVCHLPQPEVMAFDRNSPDAATAGDFLAGLHHLRTRSGVLAVTSLTALRQRVMAPGTLERATLRLRAGQRFDPDALCGALVRAGYRPAGMVAKTGDFARRGGLLDVFAPGDRPLRIEFFDDEIVSLRLFEVETQRTVARTEDAVVVPVSHLWLDDDAVLACLGRAEALLAARPEGPDADALEDLQRRLEDRLADDGIESYLPWTGPTATLIDYLPEGTTVFWCDPVRLNEQSGLLDGELPRLREGRAERDPALPAIEELVEPSARLAAPRLRHVHLAESWIAGDEAGLWLGVPPRASIDFPTTSQQLRGGDVTALSAELAAREGAGDAVLLLCDNRGQAERLGDLLDEVSADPPATRPLVGGVSAGFAWPDARLHCLTDHEFFERYRRPVRVRHRSSGVVKERASLRPGELVVHLEYGIARYQGLRVITVEGIERECLLLEYAEDGKVYVPVENIDQVERYSSDQGANPPLARLGSGSWLKVKGKARKAIRAMAAELIELYAARRAKPGFAYPPDGALQRALEDSFLWDETPDQLTAINEVKRDMESPEPMDRLVCGDVGFGKTEVAIRAAFKAVAAGKQVAVLCPTTLLAAQHGETFGERFRDFPVKVAVLNRYRTPAEQKQVLTQLAAGSLDVLVGTHRLLSRDVRFKDLGLLVVDEEQRFGVRHKERLKEMKRQVDAITLSATPIPRTLYLALMGARDMSLINTPPRDRLPIHTELCAFDKRVLVEAILRELHRGGQVFFVHNRVQTIEGMAQLIRELLPNVRVGWAHGQMEEDRLEAIMERFLAHELDVLVSTSIIESGLDMPRVNTIIIDRADRFGLAQLYQLRGRVGRSNHRAFAYLMTPPGERLTAEARRRLAALEEFQALGSGYHIAMRDLEIRGAGNLLGEEQHGHMEAIGFDLYCRLLEETVAELQGGGGVAPLDVKVELHAAAYLPDEYVGDPQHKMDLYRRVARTRRVEACQRLREEFRDRYGQPPVPVDNLLAIQRLRIMAGRLGIVEVRGGRQGCDFFFAGGREPAAPIIQGLMASGPKGLQFKASDQFVMKVPAPRGEHLAIADAMLERLASLQGVGPEG